MKTAAKDFKMSELGPIPKDWEVKRLGELLEFKNGYNTDASNFGKGVPFASVLDALSDRPATSKSILGRVVATRKAEDEFSLTYGDLIFTRSSETLEDVGRSNVYVDRCQGAIFGGFVIRGRPIFKFDSVFLNYLLKDGAHRIRVYSQGAGAQHYNIGQTGLGRVSVTLPPFPEQRKIAAALSDVDEMIAALEKLIEKKRKIKTGAMQELLGTTPLCTSADSALSARGERAHAENAENAEKRKEMVGFVPRRRLPGFKGAWVEKRFDECFELIGNNVFSREFMCHDTKGIANIHYGDVLVKYGCVLDFSKDQIDSLTLSLLIKSESLRDGDLIIADTAEDETVGKAVEVRHLGARQAVAGLHTIACRPTMEFAPGWLGYYINSSAFHNQLLPLISGTKVSSISKAGLRTTVLTFPILAEQKAIAKVLGDMDEEIAALEAELAKTRQLKQGMMQELLTGKVRLGWGVSRGERRERGGHE